MRLFVSIELPEHIKNEAIRLQEEIRSRDLFHGTFVQPDNLHITIAFFGSVDDEQVPLIAHALGTISYPAFEVELKALEPNSYSRPHVLWIRVDGPLLKPLAQNIFELLPEYKEERSFNGHITLARIKKVRERQQFKDAIQTMFVTPFSWTVTQLCLRESETLPEGPIYTTLATYKLL